MKRIVIFSTALFFTLVITWSFGFAFVVYKHYIETPWIIWVYGLINTVFFVGILTVLFTPLFLFVKQQKTINITTHFIFSAVIILEIISLFYFSITLELLGNTIFKFDKEQINIIIKSYFVFKWYYLMLPFPVVFYFFLIRLLKIKNEKPFFYSIVGIGITAVLLGGQIEKKEISYGLISKNKSFYFVQSLFVDLKNRFVILTDEDIKFYREIINHDLQNEKYPLYHPTDTNNVLINFFDLKESPPNLVFIIVESLSASFSGPNADEISYTPFLDSLSDKSIYFDNFLSTSDRSFAALPSILGSLPHGKKGFTEQKPGYPKNITLANWLIKNGYSGNFHYGGYGRFDNMDLFMINQGFTIYDRAEYNYEGTGLRTSLDSIPFGVADKQFFSDILEKTTEKEVSSPYLDVYFTLSMHYPYMIEEHEKYYQKVKQKIEYSNVDENIKAKHRKYVAELATFLYTDDALRFYFKEKSQSEQHNNTIYFIMGDHMMGEIAQANQIEKYRTVLTIYSPLLKKQILIKGTNSHLDITPSFYNLLQQKYQYTVLDSVSWLGHPFDTSSVFKCNRDILFMLNNRNADDLLHKNYFLSGDDLFKVSDRLQLTPYDNKELRNKLKKLRKISVGTHKELVTRDLLIP